MNKKLIITVQVPDGITDEEINDYFDSVMATINKSKSHVFFTSHSGRKTRSVEVGRVVNHTWDYYNDLSGKVIIRYK